MIDEVKLVELLAAELPSWLAPREYAGSYMAIRRAVAEGVYLVNDDGFVELSVMPGWSAYCRVELVAS